MAVTYTKVSTKSPKDLKVDVQPTINNVTKKLVLSASWSIGDENYGAGQQLWWRMSGQKDKLTAAEWTKRTKRYAKGHSTAKISTSATSITFAELTLTDFYPHNPDQHLRWIIVSVRGQRSKYNKKKSGKTKHYDPKWSDKASRLVNILPPPKPEKNDPSAGASDFQKIFTWSVPSSSSWAGVDTKKSKYDLEEYEIFYDTQWQTILVDNNSSSPSRAYGDDAYKSSHLGWDDGTKPAGETSSTITITETTSSWTGNYSYTRYVRVRSRGPGGVSDWVEMKYTYSNNPAPSRDLQAQFTEDKSGNYTLTITNDETKKKAYPVDYYSVQHLIDIPVTSISGGTVTISTPSENDANWVEDKRISKKGSFSFPLDTFTPEDKLIWARLVEVYGDNQQAKGAGQLVDGRKSYPLKSPTNLSITNISTTNHRVTVNATNASDVAASYLVVYYRTSKDESNKTAVDIIPHGTTSKTVQLPDWGNKQIDIGVQAMLANFDYTLYSSGVKNYVFRAVKGIFMFSDIVWDGGSLPRPPSNLKLSLGKKIDTITATWDWTWTEADAAEISWADHEDAWESTDPPSTYVIDNTQNGRWNISGLSVGDWWVRVRFMKYNEDATTYGMYCDAEHIKIVSTPDKPYLMITPSLIAPEDSVTLSWVYSSEDGAPQQKAEVVKAGDLKTVLKTADNGEMTMTLSKKDPGVTWNDGEQVQLRLRLTSGENQVSEWSDISSFRVASKPVAPVISSFIDGCWVANSSITIDEMTITKNCLVKMPLKFIVANIPANNELNISITRKSGNIIQKPDESDYPVYAGDISYLSVPPILSSGSAITVTINQDDLREVLDDGHDYYLNLTNTDPYGQATSATPIEFRVKWTHQAVKPEAVITFDRDDYTASISPKRPASGYVAGDVCDIYRLSVDKPQLVYSGAILNANTSDNTIVDPYPTIGEFGGYRIIYRTINGDYRIGSSAVAEYALTDYDDDDYIIDDFVSIIDFGANKVVLRYDLSLSNSWKKDFIETQYLGGSVQGDWNPGVSRTGTLKTTVTIQEDPFVDEPGSVVEAMRRLAVYPGVCHVRTPDGSNYYANVDVQEDREEKWVNKLAKFSLSITRVDPPFENEGLTLADWENTD